MLGIAGGKISLDVECYAGFVLISTRKFGINVNMKGRWDGGMQNKDHRSRLQCLHPLSVLRAHCLLSSANSLTH